MHGQFHFCRREPSFYPAPPFPPASPPHHLLLRPCFPSLSLLSLILPISTSLSLSLSLPSRSLRGNFFDKLFSAFFASGCKLNPPWRLEEACISRLPPGSRPPSRSPACSSPPPSPSSPPGPPAITADTKPIRAGYRLHYHFTFFVRNPKTRERERETVRE